MGDLENVSDNKYTVESEKKAMQYINLNLSCLILIIVLFSAFINLPAVLSLRLWTI